MTAHPRFASFNFQNWIERNKGSLKPPVSQQAIVRREDRHDRDDRRRPEQARRFPRRSGARSFSTSSRAT